MPKYPKYERAIRRVEQFVTDIAHPYFLLATPSIFKNLRRYRPKDTMLSLQLIEWALAESKDASMQTSARFLLLAAAAIADPAVRSSLEAWALREVFGKLPDPDLPPPPPQKLAMPQIPGMPPQIAAALNEALSTIDPNKLPVGHSVIQTSVGPLELLKMKAPPVVNFSGGDPRRN